MIILTAGNDHQGRGVPNRKFSFSAVIRDTEQNARAFGYDCIVYDLGGLGFGRPFGIEDDTFRKYGYYTEIEGGYRSKSLFKPDIVWDSLREKGDFVAYLDGDALLNDRIDEVMTEDYDVGVTLRRPEEIEDEWHRANRAIVGYLNAGVIFFRPTEATYRFVDRWKEETRRVQNDQKALNLLACPERYPEPFSVHAIDGIRIKYFPGEVYNYYYFDVGLSPRMKILHFKGPVREFYPFDWKKRLYCRIVVPAINIVKSILKFPSPSSPDSRRD